MWASDHRELGTWRTSPPQRQGPNEAESQIGLRRGAYIPEDRSGGTEPLHRKLGPEHDKDLLVASPTSCTGLL
jgi:hypothetical protein